MLQTIPELIDVTLTCICAIEEETLLSHEDKKH
jgi:hypothetical protein